MTVHLVNLTNPMMMKGPLRELIPVGPHQVRVQLPAAHERAWRPAADRRHEAGHASGRPSSLCRGTADRRPRSGGHRSLISPPNLVPRHQARSPLRRALRVPVDGVGHLCRASLTRQAQAARGRAGVYSRHGEADCSRARSRPRRVRRRTRPTARARPRRWRHRAAAGLSRAGCRRQPRRQPQGRQHRRASARHCRRGQRRHLRQDASSADLRAARHQRRRPRRRRSRSSAPATAARTSRSTTAGSITRAGRRSIATSTRRASWCPSSPVRSSCRQACPPRRTTTRRRSRSTTRAGCSSRSARPTTSTASPIASSAPRAWIRRSSRRPTAASGASIRTS